MLTYAFKYAAAIGVTRFRSLPGNAPRPKCEDLNGGSDLCCPHTFQDRECASPWDVGCMVPKLFPGAQCANDVECSTGSCKGGRCCSDQTLAIPGCRACSIFGGGCADCGEGFKLVGTQCEGACACSAGCTDAGCDCGSCSDCDDDHFLVIEPAGGVGNCRPKIAVGGNCNADTECTKGRCAGGHCCNVENLYEGCADCNTRGLCSTCDAGYTLCGHTDFHNGQCYPTLPETDGAPEAFTTFRCGTGGEGTDYPSSDGFNYCASSQRCPNTQACCYCEFQVSRTCFEAKKTSQFGGTNSFAMLPGYAPPEFADNDRQRSRRSRLGSVEAAAAAAGHLKREMTLAADLQLA